MNDVRTEKEIEMKLKFDDGMIKTNILKKLKSIFKDIINDTLDINYSLIHDKKEVKIIDEYFDDKQNILSRSLNDSRLRYRTKYFLSDLNDKYDIIKNIKENRKRMLTVKYLSKTNINQEVSKDIKNNNLDIHRHKDFITDYIGDNILDFNSLNKHIAVYNNRSMINLGVKINAPNYTHDVLEDLITICFDELGYFNYKTAKNYKEKVIEIEIDEQFLQGSGQDTIVPYSTEIQLKHLKKIISNEISNINEINGPKYLRAIKFTS